MIRAREDRGFTLLELLVVIALMGVATSLGMTMMFRVSDAWGRVSSRTDLSRVADQALDRIREDLAQTLSARLTGTTVRGVSQTAENKQFFRMTLEDDRVTIPVEIPAVEVGGAVQRANVTYAIDRSGAIPALVRTTSVVSAAGMPPASLKVADGVLAMRIEYLGKQPGARWEKEWSRAGLPRLVRVSLVLMDPARSYEQIARKGVFSIEVD